MRQLGGNPQVCGIQAEFKFVPNPPNPVGKRNNKLILTSVIFSLVNMDDVCVHEQTGSVTPHLPVAINQLVTY